METMPDVLHIQSSVWKLFYYLIISFLKQNDVMGESKGWQSDKRRFSGASTSSYKLCDSGQTH